MRDYARHQTTLLIRRLAQVVDQAARKGDAESIHDVRVVLRRLSGCLRVFAPFYPPGAARRIRKRIRVLMTAAGGVRDCDIAMELAVRAGLARSSALVRQLAARRRQAGRELLVAMRRWKRHDVVRRWGRRLGL